MEGNNANIDDINGLIYSGKYALLEYAINSDSIFLRNDSFRHAESCIFRKLKFHENSPEGSGVVDPRCPQLSARTPILFQQCCSAEIISPVFFHDDIFSTALVDIDKTFYVSGMIKPRICTSKMQKQEIPAGAKS